MSVWVKFKNADLQKLSKQAAEKGLGISDGTEYNTHTENYNALRMGFASLNSGEQERAIDILEECLQDN